MQVSEEIQSSQYDSKHFTIALGLPVSLALRNHSINLYLEERLESFDDEEVTPIKQVSSNIGCYLDNGSFFTEVTRNSA